jgi:hypothetical protein
LEHLITEILSPYKVVLSKAYKPCLNHAIRVGCMAEQLSKSEFNKDKFSVACAFHDLGIWTEKTWDYLQPSEILATDYLAKTNQNDWNKEVMAMIHHHHKLSRYKGEYEETVELFRKADLIDFSYDLILFDISREWYSGLKQKYPTNGLHKELGWNFWKHFKSKPWNPFPMVRF